MKKGILLFFFLFLLSVSSASAITIEITATVPGCGDGIVGVGEQCDGGDLAGASCSSQGFSSGTLSCSSACTFVTSQCSLTSGGGGSSGGGGGGGGGSSLSSIPNTNVVFTGRAYPRSIITLLKDAQVVATTVAGSDANFQITISGTSGGSYIFSVYSEDNKGVRSSLLSFPVSVTAGVTTKVSGIFVAPTIATDKSEVRRGDNITIFGQSIPNSEVTISVNSEEEHFLKKYTDTNGVYLVNFDTSVLEIGQHHTRSKTSFNNEITAFGKTASFIVGDRNVLATPTTPTSSKGDVNNDRRVNLVDFSVAAYWYKRSNPPKTSDLNSDGKVDLVDFSIMAFNWTG